MDNHISFSEIESGILNLKIGRCNSVLLDQKTLYKAIFDSRYDCVRLKVPAEDEFAPKKLNEMGMPFFFSGSIRKYKTPILEKPATEYHYSDLVWEYYDGSQDKLLKDMLIGTWGDYPIGYYRTPYLSEVVTKEAEIESVFQYYRTFNNPNKFSNNNIVFMKHGEAYVGFFALNKVSDDLESHVGGILEPYRRGRYFLDKLSYIKRYCIDNNLIHFIFGARNENARVQRIFQYVGFQPIGTDNVFHITSFLTQGYNRSKIISVENFTGFKPSLFGVVNEDFKTILTQTPNIMSVNMWSNLTEVRNEKQTIFRFTPVNSEECRLFTYVGNEFTVHYGLSLS